MMKKDWLKNEKWPKIKKKEAVDVNVARDTSPNKNKNKLKEATLRKKWWKTVSECNKLSGLITNIFGRNINILSKQEYDYVRIKYGEIINGSLLTKGDNSIDHVGNA